MAVEAVLFAPPLPLAALVPATALSLVALALGWRGMSSIQGRFVLATLWLRFIFDAYPAYTLKPVAAGLTPIALLSIATAAVGFLVIERRHLLFTFLLPFYALIAVVWISSLIDNNPVALLNQTTKFLYLIVVLIACYEALQAEGTSRFSGALLWAFAPLFILLPISVMLGAAKVTKSDQSVAYVAGFNHESIYSLAVSACFVVACFADRVRWPIRLFVMFACLGALALANYRTVIAAMVPVVAWQFVRLILATTRREGRGLLLIGMASVGLIGLVATAGDFGDRFQDLVVVAMEPGEMIRPTAEFTVEERRFASARSWVWSSYAEAYRDSDPLRKLVGHGPDSWEGVFEVYAQNTLLSYLYEFGILGALTVTILWLTMGLLALRCAPGQRLVLVITHLAFFIMNMSTQPFWLIEGLLLYALICGYTVHFSRVRVGAGERKVLGRERQRTIVVSIG